MLNKSNRINKTRELNKVYRSGRAVHSASLVIKFSASKIASDQKKIRIAFVASKKVSKKAVERNRVKRVLRDEARAVIEKLLPGEYIIIFKAAAAELTNPQLREQFHTILKRGNLWQK